MRCNLKLDFFNFFSLIRFTVELDFFLNFYSPEVTMRCNLKIAFFGGKIFSIEVQFGDGFLKVMVMMMRFYLDEVMIRLVSYPSR